jgi:hypothetical protein
MNEIDFVILELEVVLGFQGSVREGMASFVFIDIAPHYPKVQKIINQIEENEDAIVVSHNISTSEITEKTNLHGLEFTKH